MLHRGFSGGDPEAMSDAMGKGTEMSKDIARLQEAFALATRLDYVFRVDKEYMTIYSGSKKTLMCPKLVLNW